MKSEQEKLRQQLLKKESKRKEKEEFILSLPISISDFQNLFDALNEELENEPCDHSMQHTERFLDEHHLPVEKTVLWLHDNGGYCDCEVILNVEEKFEGM